MTRAERTCARAWGLFVLCCVAACACPRAAWAHKPSDAYLALSVSGAVVSVRWDLALRDLDDELGLDRDENGTITWGEARSGAAAVSAAAWPALEVRAGDGDGAICTQVGADAPPAIVRHTDGAYLVLRRELSCGAPPRALALRYGLFFARDPQHRAVVRVDSGAASRSLVLSATQREARVDLADPAPGRRAFLTMLREGASHIAQGYDHLLFLFALLLPSVLARRPGRPGLVPVAGLRPALLDVLRVVTAFTAAHSLTLSLAALDVVRLPARLVESAIAASVVFAAVGNLRPARRASRRRWAAAFVLGLMHGFGFSAALSDLELGRGALVVSLLGFNVGVELGQLALVIVTVPLAFAARRTWFYRRVVLGLGSIGIACVALVWLAERALAVKLWP